MMAAIMGMYVGSVSGLFDCPSGDVNRALVTGAFWVGGEEAEVAAAKTSETRKEETDDNETEKEVVAVVVMGREEEEEVEEAAYDVISGPEDDASIESLAELLKELTADVDGEDESLVWAEAADNQKQRIAAVKTSCPRILPPRCVLSTGQK